MGKVWETIAEARPGQIKARYILSCFLSEVSQKEGAPSEGITVAMFRHELKGNTGGVAQFLTNTSSKGIMHSKSRRQGNGLTGRAQFVEDLVEADIVKKGIVWEDLG